MIALVTANLGGIDPVFALPTLPAEVDAFYFTDGLARDRTFASRTWSRTVTEPPCSSPRLRSKFFKCQICRLPDSPRYSHLAWADSCLRFSSLDFLQGWAADVPADGNRAVLVPHPDRKSVAEEYEYVLQQIARGNEYLSSRYDPAPLVRERRRFDMTSDLTSVRLWAGGIWLFANCPRTCALFDAWWDCVNHFSIFDQAAFSVLLSEHGIEPAVAEVDLYRNALWERIPHA